MSKKSLTIRYALSEDFDGIKHLLTRSLKRYFGPLKRCLNCRDMFRNDVIKRYVIFDENDRSQSHTALAGYAEISENPYLPALPYDCWPIWMAHHYCMEMPISITNTLFINFLAYHPIYEQEILLIVLQECFLSETNLKFILIVEMPDEIVVPNKEAPNYNVLDPHSVLIFPNILDVEFCRNGPRIHVINRKNIITEFTIRPALPGDNDYCVDIVDKDRPDIRLELGDFYIAEELIKDDADTHGTILVAEQSADFITAFIWLDDHIDIKKLRDCYDIDEFGNLYKIPTVENESETETDTDETAIENKEIISNMFCIKLLGVNNSIDSRRIFKLLLTTFQSYPNKDYCIITIPQICKESKALTEVLNYFVRIPPRINGKLNDKLYIASQGAIRGTITLSKIRKEDSEVIEGFLSHLEETAFKKNLFDIRSIQRDVSSEVAHVKSILEEVLSDEYSEYIFLTIRCCPTDTNLSEDETIIVGYLILRPFYSVHALSKHFLLPLYYNQFGEIFAELISVKLNPFFRHQVNIILRQTRRLTGYRRYFYFQSIKNKSNNKISNFSNDLLAYLQPVEPRWIKRIETDMKLKKIGKHIDVTQYYSNGKFGLFIGNLRPVAVFGNTQTIVIIGFTDTVKAFLRILVFSWNFKSSGQQKRSSHCCLAHLKVIVVANPGVVEGEYANYFTCDTCTDQENCWVNCQNSSEFIKDATERIDLRHWVEFVDGCVQLIDSNLKVVVLDNGCVLPYETLLIACETEFGLPEKLYCRSDNEIALNASNYAHINCRYDKICLYRELKILSERKNDYKITIYGSHIRVFEFINFLLKHGHKANCITWIVPSYSKHRCFADIWNNPHHDDHIETVLQDMAVDLGVIHHHGWNFSKWLYDNKEKRLFGAIFRNHVSRTDLEVATDFFVSFADRYLCVKFQKILARTKIAILNDNVLVNENYETSEPNVYALGNFIRHFIEPNHQYNFVNPKEASEKLLRILNIIDRDTAPDTLSCKYKQSHYFQADLPLGHRVVNVTIPKRYIMNAQTVYNQQVMNTYKKDFCCVRMNDHGFVEQVLCITKKDSCLDFLQYICGKHDEMLNNVSYRWHTEAIENFLEFFQQPWSELLVREQFDTLFDRQIQNCEEEVACSLQWKLERTQRKEKLRKNLNEKGMLRDFHKTLLDFLRENRHDFHYPFALPEDFHIV